MRLPRTLSICLIREILIYASVGFLGVSSVLVAQNLLRRIGELGGLTLSAGEIASIAGCLVAMLASNAVPVAFLFGVLAAIGRVSSDSEWAAMKSLGISFAQFSGPVIGLGAVVGCVTAVLLNVVEPLARRELRALASEIASNGSMIRAGTFLRLVKEGKRLLFVEERDNDLSLRGVMISDRTNEKQPFTVFAERGHFEFKRDESMAHLTLQNGDIHFDPTRPREDRYRRIAFGQFRYAFDFSSAVGSGLNRVRPPELPTSRIVEALNHFKLEGRAPDWARVGHSEPYEIQFHRRLALPFAPLLFAVIGVPLGLRRSRGARSWGVLLCVTVVISYYAALIAGQSLSDEGYIPTAVSVWAPNVILTAVSAWFLIRARHAEL